MKLYVSSEYGNDLNDGSELAPFASLYKALEVVDTTPDSTIYILNCEIQGGDYVISRLMYGLHIVGIGDAILNCTGFETCLSWADDSKRIYFVNLQMYGFSRSAFFQQSGTITDDFEFSFQNCTIFNRGALYDVAKLWDRASSYDAISQRWTWKNCTLYGIDIHVADGQTSGNYIPRMRWYDSIIQTDIVPENSMYQVVSRVFSNQAVVTEPAEYTLASFPPPFVSSDNDALDLRFDPDHPQFRKYVSAGSNGSVCGNFSRGVFAWTKLADEEFSLSNNRSLGIWENDTNTYNSTPPTIEITAGVNDRVDFNEGGAELSAILTAQVYANAAALATEIAIKMDALATATITSYESATEKVVIASDGATFNLLWATGTNTAINAGLVCGFDDSEDDTAQTLYVADGIPNTTGVGVSTSALIFEGQIIPDLAVNPEAEYAIAVSPILDLRVPKTMERLYLASFVEGSGSIDSTIWQDITISAGVNDKIDFDEGGSELTATIAAGLYATGAALATEIQTQMNAVAVAAVTVEYTISGRIKISSVSANFNLLWNTGANTATSAKTVLGFADTDLTGALEYEAVDALNGGFTVDVRGSNTIFGTQDAPATTTLDWTAVEINGFETMTWEYRFYQIRIRLNLV